MTDFESLYRKYSADVFRFALYLSGNRAEAEDITSETFVRAWNAPGKIETATVKGYLFAIARNLFLQDRRKKQTYVELNEKLADSSADPQSRSEDRANLEETVKRLQKLPEIDRAAVLMRAMDGMPYEEIARVLNISLSSAKVKVHRARLALMLTGKPDDGWKSQGE